MSFVDVFPTEPVIAHDASIAAGADGTAQRGERGDARRRARAWPRRRARARRRGTPRRRETTTNRSPGPIRRESTLTPVIVFRVALEPPGASSAHLGERQRDHVRASLRTPPRSLAVVERNRPVGELLALLGSLAGDEDDVARLRELDRARDRGSAVELDLDGAARLRPRSRRRSPRDPRCAGCRTSRSPRRRARRRACP